MPVIVEGDEKNAITSEFKKNIAEIFDINDIFIKGQNKKEISQKGRKYSGENN